MSDVVPRPEFNVVAEQLRKVMEFMQQHLGMNMDEAGLSQQQPPPPPPPPPPHDQQQLPQIDSRVWSLPCWDLTETSKRDDGIDLLKDKQALQRLTEIAEKAKMDLSSLTQTNIRAKFEELCSDLLDGYCNHFHTEYVHGQGERILTKQITSCNGDCLQSCQGSSSNHWARKYSRWVSRANITALQFILETNRRKAHNLKRQTMLLKIKEDFEKHVSELAVTQPSTSRIILQTFFSHDEINKAWLPIEAFA
ncbi:hypothetical protein Syun_018855 [Stephania yunnanensis]|uniref:Uncharacterized protein n=1 Tax=Stephania yunnanensis TaxID=152371 RepID=A0AAP0NW66_9MAGN